METAGSGVDVLEAADLEALMELAAPMLLTPVAEPGEPAKPH